MIFIPIVAYNGKMSKHDFAGGEISRSGLLK